jgi:multidrug efflux pump subunit AcrB
MEPSVRLRDVADMGRERTSNLIARENGKRKAVISCNVAEGYNLGQLVEEVKKRVEPIVTKAGCTLALGGQFEAQQSASKTILVMGAFVIVVMLLLVNAALGSMRAAVLVMVNLPLSLIGGIVAIYLTESPSLFWNTLALFGLGSERYVAPVISIASMVGFITLFGIAVRNGILLVRHYFDSDARRRPAAGSHPARIDGAARADPDDGAHGRTGTAAHRDGCWRARQRDPRPALGSRAGRPLVLDLSQPARRASRVLPDVQEPPGRSEGPNA